MPANPIGVALRGRRAGHHTLAWARPDLQAPENFTLTSPAFDHGAPIPEKHRGRLFGANISPAAMLLASGRASSHTTARGSASFPCSRMLASISWRSAPSEA